MPGNKMTRLCAYKQRCSFIEFHYAWEGKKFNIVKYSQNQFIKFTWSYYTLKTIRNNRNHNLLLHFWFSPRIKTYLCTFYFGRPISSAYTRNFLRSILGNGRCYLRQQRDWFINQIRIYSASRGKKKKH